MRMTICFVLISMLMLCGQALGQPTVDPCIPTPTTRCLNNDRFQVEVHWSTEAGASLFAPTDQDLMGIGRNTPVSDIWTGMWFFDPDNLDVLIHLFAGCGNNDRFWVFASGLTDVEVTLIVTDTQTGEEQAYINPLGRPFEAITDTEAFATCPKSHQPQAMQPVAQQQSPPADQLLGMCVESATTACLSKGRFALSLTAFGADVQAQRLADGTAGFLFGNPSFFDVFASIVDGGHVNGQNWVTYSVFPGTGSFTLTVTDTVDGGSQVYEYAAGGALLVQDQAAFTAPPALLIDGTLSGSWYALERDGEGFIFDVTVSSTGEPILVLYYFTFEDNDSGRQAWLVGVAPIIGNRASVPVVIADGAQFGNAFDPDNVQRTDWGNIKVTFLSCDRVLIESDSTLFPALSYEAGRLTPPPIGVEGACQATRVAGQHVNKRVDKGDGIAVDGGYSGSWYNAAERNGEGFIFNVANIGGVDTLVVFYFTYENNDSGRQAWLVGSAPIVGNTADVPMFITSGTRFGAGFAPDDVVRTPAGNVQVTWQSCTAATAVITSPLGNLTIDLTPLTAPHIGTTGACAP